MNTWFIMAIIAALFWAVGQVFIKKGLSSISPLWNNIFMNTVTIFVWLPVVLIFGRSELKTVSWYVIFLVFVATFMYMIYPYILNKGELSLIGTLHSLYPLATVFFSLLLLGERLTFVQAAGVGLIGISILFIAAPEKLSDFRKKNMSWVYWGLCSATLMGFADLLAKDATNKSNAFSYVFLYIFAAQLISIILYIIDKSGRKLPKFDAKTWVPSLIGTFLLETGVLIFLLSFDFGNVSLIAPVSGTYQAMSVVLAVIFLREKVRPIQAIGIIASTIGIILIGLI